MIEVILVDESDKAIGKMEKLEAHKKGLLHRAITVYIFNSKGELLLQRRAKEKYHCGGLWSNTCCGHPYPQESTHGAAHRRLKEEMGIHSSLNPLFETSYELALNNGLIEHEYDHVYFGMTDENPTIDFREADEWCYISIEKLKYEMQDSPEKFTPWFLITLPLFLKEMRIYNNEYRIL